MLVRFFIPYRFAEPRATSLVFISIRGAHCFSRRCYWFHSELSFLGQLHFSVNLEWRYGPFWRSRAGKPKRRFGVRSWPTLGMGKQSGAMRLAIWDRLSLFTSALNTGIHPLNLSLAL